MKGCQIKYYYSLKIFLHFKLENPHTNPSQPTTVDQIWKLFAIIMKKWVTFTDNCSEQGTEGMVAQLFLVELKKITKDFIHSKKT